MSCEDFLPLIEKLADGEVSAAEKLRGEAHLRDCRDCSAHYRFLNALPEAARQASLPEPPEMYWDVLPRKIMSRIGAVGAGEARRGWFFQLLSPSRLRWAGALAAALVATVVGLRVLETPHPSHRSLETEDVPRAAEENSTGEDAGAGVLEEGRDDKSSADETAPTMPQVILKTEESSGTGLSRDAGKEGLEKAEAGGRAYREDRAATGRPTRELDEVVPGEPGEGEEAQRRTLAPMEQARQGVPEGPSEQTPTIASAGEDRRDQEARPAPSAPPGGGEMVAESLSLRDSPEAARSTSPAESNYRHLLERYPLPVSLSDDLRAKTQNEDEAQPAEAVRTECAAWRDFVERYPGDEHEGEARFRLARCSIALVGLLPSEETRRQALEDGSSYLEIEPEGARAEAIRRALELIGR